MLIAAAPIGAAVAVRAGTTTIAKRDNGALCRSTVVRKPSLLTALPDAPAPNRRKLGTISNPPPRDIKTSENNHLRWERAGFEPQIRQLDSRYFSKT
jgi:hypothetical protein